MDSDVVVLDLWREQADSLASVDAWRDPSSGNSTEWAEEDGQINASVGPFLEWTTRERRACTFRRQCLSYLGRRRRSPSQSAMDP